MCAYDFQDKRLNRQRYILKRVEKGPTARIVFLLEQAFLVVQLMGDIRCEAHLRISEKALLCHFIGDGRCNSRVLFQGLGVGERNLLRLQVAVMVVVYVMVMARSGGGGVYN